MEKMLRDLTIEGVEFAPVKNEDVLHACMTTCMNSVAGDCEKDKKSTI
jgi:hypothetical protein